VTGPADRTVAAIVADARRILEAAGLGDADLVGVGWATVELDRAESEFAASVGFAGGGWADAPRDALLGATARLGPEMAPGGPRLVLLEPDTEGRLAASLARHGEGLAVAYVALQRDTAGWSPVAEGPLGPACLRPGPVAGPHLVALALPS